MVLQLYLAFLKNGFFWTYVDICHCIPAAPVQCQNENESFWLFGRALWLQWIFHITAATVRQILLLLVSNRPEEPRFGSSWTLFIVAGVSSLGPSCELMLHAWLVIDKDEAIILLQHAILVPRPIAYLRGWAHCVWKSLLWCILQPAPASRPILICTTSVVSLLHFALLGELIGGSGLCCQT